MMYEWSDFDPYEKPTIEQQLEDENMFELVMESKKDGAQYHFMVLAVLAPLPDFHCALIYCREKQALNTIEPK